MQEWLRFRGQNATSFKEEEKYIYDLAVVCYPSLSIDLLYDFKKVQPMPNHPVIFSSPPIKYRKDFRHLLSPYFPSLSHIAFVSGRCERHNRHKVTVFTTKKKFNFLFHIILISFTLRIKI